MGFHLEDLMTLSPRSADLLAACADAPGIDLSTITAVEFREAFTPPEGEGSAVAKVVDLAIDADGHEIPIRLYHPFAQGRVPITLYVHGGGFVIGDLDMTDAVCRGTLALCPAASSPPSTTASHPRRPSQAVCGTRSRRWSGWTPTPRTSAAGPI